MARAACQRQAIVHTTAAKRPAAAQAPTRGVAGRDVEPVARLQRHRHVHRVAAASSAAAAACLQPPLAGSQVCCVIRLGCRQHALSAVCRACAGVSSQCAATGARLAADQALQGGVDQRLRLGQAWQAGQEQCMLSSWTTAILHMFQLSMQVGPRYCSDCRHHCAPSTQHQPNPGSSMLPAPCPHKPLPCPLTPGQAAVVVAGHVLLLRAGDGVVVLQQGHRLLQGVGGGACKWTGRSLGGLVSE